MARRDRRLYPSVYPAADPAGSVIGAMQAGMLGDAVVRLSESTAPRGFTGGHLEPQVFVRAGAPPNDPDTIELAPIQLNTRRALNRARGQAN